MPTLAARNSPVTTTTATAMSTISSNSADIATTTPATATAPTTTANTNIVNHYYHHPPAPPAHSVAAAAGGGSGGSTNTTATTTATTTTTMTTNVAPSLATFNGNSNLNVANGNIVGAGHVGAAAGNTNTNANNSSNNIGKKPLSTLASSREDVTSLGGTSSINSQLSANNHNNSAGSGNSNSNNNGNGNHIGGGSNQSSSSNGGHSNNNNNNNSSSSIGIIKGSKENLLQNYYNGIGNDGAGGLATHSSDNDDPGDGLGPLPPKWETAYTERGELYFIDHNTGTSHWLDPRLSKFQKKSLEDCSDDELPYGWEKIEDSLYGTYYIDHVNRRTQYENPVLEAKRRAAEQNQKQQQQQQQQQQSQNQQQSQQQPQQTQQQQRPQTPSILLNGGAIASDAPGSRAGIVAPSAVGNVLDISQRGMQPPPPGVALNSPPAAHLPYKFTRNPAEMQGERITSTLLKSARGLGITIVGGDDGVEEFLQIKSIVPNGPAWLDGQLQTGDVLVYVNDTCVLGFTHHEMVNIFQSILPGENVTLEVCRGYPLPFDPNDPNTEVVTTIAVDGISAATDKQRRMLLNLHMDGNYNFLDVSGESNGKGSGGAHGHLHARSLHSPAMLGGPTAAGGGGSGGGLNDGFILMKKSELVQTFAIVKGAMGFGFTIADSAYGQKVKKILDRNCCTQLQEGDILLEINNVNVRQKSHLEVVQLLKDCSKTEPTIVKIQRGIPANVSPGGLVGYSSSSGDGATTATNGAGNGSCLGNVAKLRKNFVGSTVLFRSKTPTADLYSTQQKEILPIRPKTPLVDTRRARVQTPNNELQQQDDEVAAATATGAANGDSCTRSDSKSQLDGHHKSTSSLQEMDALNQDIPFMDPYPKLVTSLSERLAEATLLSDAATSGVGGLTGYQHGSIAMNSASNTLGMRGAATHYEQQEYVTAGAHGLGVGGNYNPIYGMSPMPPSMSSLYPHAPPPSQHLPHFSANSVSANSGAAGYSPSTPLSLMTPPSPHSMLHPHHQHAALAHAQYSPGTLHGATPLQAAHIQNERMQRRVNELLNDRRRVGFSALDTQQHQSSAQQQQHNHMLGGIGYQQPPPRQQQSPLQHSPAVSSISQQPPISAHWLGGGGCYNTLQPAVATNLPYVQRNGLDASDADGEQYELNEVTLERQALGFGFRIVGGTEEGSQVTVGHVVPGGAADNDQRINTGDEILSIDGINVVNSSHHKVVSLMGEAALRGQVNMILRRRVRPAHSQQPPPALGMPMRTTLRYPYDVIVTRHEAEGFGFVIISSSNQYYGSTIGKLIPGSPADRCGELNVGDRIVAVNRIDIAGMSHGDVVNLIKESGLHVRLTIGAPKEQGNTGISGNNALLINSAQSSPGQLSQTQQLMQSSLAQQSPVAMTTLLTPTQQQQQQQQQNQQQQNQQPQNQPQQKHLLSPLLQTEPNGAYFERPSTSASAAVVMTQQQHQHQHQHQHQQQQQQPPQL